MTPPLVHLTPLDRAYPTRLRCLLRPPASLTTRGGVLEAERAVAIVGSRLATDRATEFAHELAMALVRAGAVVVSGGAVGIDAAAHRGALDGGGRTWGVAGTGSDHCFPPEHADLFDAIGRGPGAMIWPFAPLRTGPGLFVARNRILVALSDAVVVVQAGDPSGALRAAGAARALSRPLWVVPAPPWMDGFAGSRHLLAEGARPLTCIHSFLRALQLETKRAARGRATEMPPAAALSPTESIIWKAVSTAPLHLDEIADRAHVAAQAAAAALLTLALENVVVEDPPGFFRRRDSSQSVKIVR